MRQNRQAKKTFEGISKLAATAVMWRDLDIFLRNPLIVEPVYHGRTVPSCHFHRKYVYSDQANMQEGPGFYLSTHWDDARRYGGNVIRARLELPCCIDTDTPFHYDFALCRQLIKNLTWCCPKVAWRQALENWSGGATDMQKSLQRGSTLHAVLMNYWWDLYTARYTESFLRVVTPYIQGIRLPRPDGITHYLVFDPDCIIVDDQPTSPEGH